MCGREKCTSNLLLDRVHGHCEKPEKGLHVLNGSILRDGLNPCADALRVTSHFVSGQMRRRIWKLLKLALKVLLASGAGEAEDFEDCVALLFKVYLGDHLGAIGFLDF